ncbi:hypothetical protein AURDEDRAFT_184670 [Auricularia subglabra TFB-10046 SS5]|nr:hypothetical protein AURDEDRAFT_184670 [Auricularia subglabra TFB-10046 SS5]
MATLEAPESPSRPPSFDSYSSSPSSSSSSSLASLAQSNFTSPTLVDFETIMIDVQTPTPLKWPQTPENPLKEDAASYFAPAPQNNPRHSLLRAVSFTKHDSEPVPGTGKLRSKVSVPALIAGWTKGSRKRAESNLVAPIPPSPTTSISSLSTVSARTSEESQNRARCDSLDSSVGSEVDPAELALSKGRLSSVPYAADDSAAARQCDRRTTELLTTLAQGSPSFFAYSKPPRRVLDLGCGDGAWMLMAAQRWTSTDFVGVDSRQHWPSHDHMRHKRGLSDGAINRIDFRTANFLCDLDSFPAESFDLVRMAYLGLSLPKGSWRSLLADVKRLLTPGGRIEFIDEAPIMPSDEPFEFGLDSAGDVASMLETQFKQMLAARGLLAPNLNLRDSFWERPIHCLQEYVGNASRIAGFEVSLPPSSDDDDYGEKTVRPRKSTVRLLDDLGAKPRKEKDVLLATTPQTPGATATLDAKLLVRSFSNTEVQHSLRMTALDAQLHASRNLQLVLSHKEALWKHICASSGEGAVLRHVFDDACWDYECAQRERLGLGRDDPVDDWEDPVFSYFPTKKSAADAPPSIQRRVRVIQVWEARKNSQ